MKNTWKALANAVIKQGASIFPGRACEAGRSAPVACEGVVLG